MQVTRRFYGGVGLCAFLGVGAILLREPVLLSGSVTIGAWLITRQYRFIQEISETLDELTVIQRPARTQAVTNDTVKVELKAVANGPTTVPLKVEANPPDPTGVTDQSARTVTLRKGDEEVSTTFTLECPVAGRFRFDLPVVTVTDSTGFFRRSIPYGSTPVLTVKSHDVTDMSVRKAGSKIGESFGEWHSGEKGLGMDFADIRKYVTGDSIQQIDWKATARRNELHVREFEDESDRSTALVVDRRSPMNMGQQRQTKLDYARHIALGWLSERGTREPIGLYVVDEQQLGVRLPPDATTDHYSRIRTHLYDLIPEEHDSPPKSTVTRPRRRPPDAAHLAASRLETDSTQFGMKLAPLFEDPQAHAHEIETDPLYRTVRRASRLTSTAEIVVITDDTNRTEVREAVRVARRGGSYVVLFLAPSVLFEQDDLDDAESTYQRYEEYESFRRDLEELERVSVFEYAPGQRMDAILDAKRNRTRRRSNA